MLRVLVVATLLTFITTVASGADSKGSSALPMSFVVKDGAIHASGTVNEDTLIAWKELESKVPLEGRTIVFDSPGGVVRTGLEIGRAIRRLKMETKILPQRVCKSMCVFIFAAGIKRTAAMTSIIAVHQIFIPDAPGSEYSKSQYSADDVRVVLRDTGQMAIYLAEMNISGELLGISLQTPPSEPLHILTREEMKRTRLIN